MQRYLVQVSADGRRTEMYVDADSPLAAAERASRSVHSGCAVEPDGDGDDLYGSFLKFRATNCQRRIPFWLSVRIPAET